jgi:flagellar motor switch protein FliN/FliY
MSEPLKSFDTTETADRRDSSPENRFKRSIFSVPVTVTVTLGRRRMTVSEILELHEHSVVPLNVQMQDPIELMVDERVIARGDLIELDEGGLALKITEIVEAGGALR